MPDREKDASAEPIHPEVARACTLPARFYTEPDVLEAEKHLLFGRTWQVVGRSAQVAQAGDYFTAEVAGEPLLLARDAAGALRGFYNVCRHRAGPPATGSGSRKVFRCGYHGWTYGLDGCLLNAPEFEGVQDFRPQEFGLAPVQAGEWGGLVFVNLDPKAEPLLPALRELPQQAAGYDLSRLRRVERRDYVMECNWKTYIDNFLEGYHLPSVHPSLNRELDYGSYVTETFARHSLQASPIRPAAGAGAPRRYAQATGEERAEYFWIFPNWMLNCYPDNVSLNIVLPLGPERSVAIFEWYFAEELMGTEAPARTVRFSDEIQLEDGAICEAVQRNLRSRSYSRGRYSVKQERCLHHFHRLYAEAMGAG
ncbi:MAG TPA: aromatic ring-hydroxylating dioxygenase subunit alpha [Terriglobales bacterium]|jgi:choline monooxygenase|nr:aromatic ring-hydroxylating dioxygenase subunit alpha [Terriglobales bacterium]